MSEALTPEASVMQLEQDAQTFLDALKPDAMEATIARELAAFDAKYTHDDVYVGSAEARAKYEQASRAKYDAALKERATTLQTSLASTETAIATVLEMVSTIPDPILVARNSQGTETTIELRRLRTAFEMDRAERLLTGKTVAAVHALYERADDEDPIRYIVERETKSGWSGVALMPSDDALTPTRLAKTIEAARRARVEKNHPELVELEARVSKLKKSAVLDQSLRHLLRDARGLALVR